MFIEITATNSTFKVYMGAYVGQITETVKGSWYKGNISFHLYSEYILVLIDGEKEWKINVTQDLENGVLQVDKIGGVNTDTLDNLYNWLEANHEQL